MCSAAELRRGEFIIVWRVWDPDEATRLSIGAGFSYAFPCRDGDSSLCRWCPWRDIVYQSAIDDFESSPYVRAVFPRYLP
jgi:hypothetical protein